MPRNSSGTYALPAGNPVVTGTLIETNWANPTMSDIGSALTDSLDRFGRGGMLAQLKLADGTLAAPAFAFNSEASTGLYRPAAATMNLSVLGTLVASFTNTSILLNKNTTVNGTLTAAGFILTGVIAWFGGTAALPGLAVAGDLDTGFYSVTANTVGASTNGVSRWLTTDEGLGLNATVAALSNVGPQLQVRGRDTTHGGWISSVESTGGAWLGLYSGITVADNPAVIFNNTGVLRFGTSTAQAVTGFSELMRLNAAGQLGIGGLPDARFTVNNGDIHVNPAAATDGQIVVNRATVAAMAVGLNSSAVTNSFGAVAGAAYLGAVAGSSNPPLVLTTQGTERVRVNTDGRVGVGRIASAGLLEVAGSVGAIIPNSANDISFTASMTAVAATALGFNNTGVTNAFGAPTGTMYVGTAQGVPLVFSTSGLERARFAASGEYGIGTTSLVGSNRLLEVGNTARTSTFVRVNGAAASQSWLELFAVGVGTFFAGINTSGGAVNGLPNNTVGIAAQNLPLVFSTGGVDVGRFDTAGNFGVGGTPGGAAKAEIFLANSAFPITLAALRLNNSGSQTALDLFAASALAGRIRSDSGGNLNHVATGTGNQVFWGGGDSGVGSSRFNMTSDGRFFGNALHNNAGAVTGTTNQYVASGTYTPTVTAGGNITSPASGGSAKWIRVGNVVNVCATVSGTVTADSTVSTIGISLPIASNFTVFSDCLGAATSNVAAGGYARDAQAAAVTGSAASDIALLVFTSQVGSATRNYVFTVTFQYEIL